ncbi:MAG: PAS domain S-box protein, partial [Ignavibacteria bacterium]|nr:PAS domain S-box protein [Ignavibacteria bacterium]
MKKNYLSKRPLIIVILLVIVILISSIYYVSYLWNSSVKEHSEKAIKASKLIISALNLETLKKLRGVPEEVGTIPYENLKKRFIDIRSNLSDVRFAYLLIMKNDKLYFMIDSEPVDSKDYSPPGQELVEARPEDKKPFKDGKILVTEPTVDRWGTWVSILVPIKDEATGRVLVVFGIDYDADTWGKSILSNVFKASLVILVPLILLILFSLKLLSKNKILAKEIIERKSTEKTLRKSEEKFRSVTESANDAIITADSNGLIIDWNNSAEKMFGYTSREIINKNLELIIPQDYRDKHIKGIKLVEQSEKQHVIGKTVELHGVHKNGNEFPLELSLSEWKTSTGSYYTGIIRDITDRKHAEEELRKLSRAIVQSPVGIIITDPDGNIEYANPKFTENSNYSLEEIKGKNPRILKSGYHQKDFYEEMWDTILSGKDWVG